jgi:uncharacterized protein YqeY
MLSGDKRLVEVLRGLKSAILYKEVADGKREAGLSDEEIVTVFKKEQKSRRDAIALYEQAKETARADEEKYQLDVISKYMPEELSEEAVVSLVREVLDELGIEQPETKDMGRIIGAIKVKASNADGALVAKVVKEQVNSKS